MMMADRAICIVFSDDDLLPEGPDHVRPLYITVGCSGRRVPSVLLDNGSALNVCPLATAIALGFAPSDFGFSTQTVRAYDSTKMEVMGTLVIDLQIGPAIFSTLFQTLEIEDFHRDFVAMSFDQHSSTVVLDMMRGMTFLPGMGLGRRQQGPSEFIAAIDHDMTFGLGFILPRSITVTWRDCDRRFDSVVEKVHSVVHIDRKIELLHLFHQLQLIVPHDEYRNEMDRMTMSQIIGIVQLQLVSPFDMFGVSTIEGASDLVDPPLSFDVLSGFVFHSDDVSVASFMDLNDEVTWPDPDRNSFDHDSDPVDERMREIDLFIYSGHTWDVFAWSYEDMPDLDPSIVQHHLPILPHARPVKQKLRRLHPRWSLQVKEEIQKTTQCWIHISG
ncbi:hypothetical protein CK203_106831 [Vitis vinifera]|uniref:Uncharacterized protein n=1 Tax=Vitis vinifera TaxID=29760 RepID=A0A438EQV0_VITVI|nr:hypothetical protein CK203_106831 [Vitis vinifera]